MSFFKELKRRNVFRVGVAYAVAAWVLLQAADLVLENISAPEWVIQALMLVISLGFVAAIVIAWAYEITPEGIKREADVDHSQSITNETALKLDRIIIGFLVVAVTVLLVERFITPGKDESPTADTETHLTEMANKVQQDSAPANPPQTGVAENSIAVLPFANRSNVEDDQFFTDGIHDDLLTLLAKIGDLRVISRTSMMKYKNTQLSIPEIGRELDVSTILEGGVQRAGKRIRINAQLIDVASDKHIWAETFDREMTIENIFEIQTEITRRIVTAVRGELTDTESAVLSQLPTDSLEAYEAYLQAKAIINRADYAPENYIEAEFWARKAIELDPEYAQAWAVLVEIHGQAIWLGYDSSPERFRAAREAVDKAVRFGPDLSETLAAQGEYLYRIDNDYSASVDKFQVANELAPGDANILQRLAVAQRRAGPIEEAIANFVKTVALDPGNSRSATLLIETLIGDRQFERTLPLIDQWMLKFPDARDMRVYKSALYLLTNGDRRSARALIDSMAPWSSDAYLLLMSQLPMLERDFERAIAAWEIPEIAAYEDYRGYLGFADYSRGLAHQLMGDSQKADRFYDAAIKTVSSATPTGTITDGFELQVLARAFARKGDFEKALQASLRGKEIMSEDLDILFGTGMSMVHAQILALAGRRAESLKEIERLLRQPYGFTPWFLYLDPAWDFFRDDERFNELIRPLNLEEALQ
ncbi:MAG: hypothetical protein IID60_06205 [Proteobacteria bacterium]|nr:hypothetical protein [Pseudomonadota bacterium]